MKIYTRSIAALIADVCYLGADALNVAGNQFAAIARRRA